MMRYITITLFFLFLLFSCNEKIIYYEYNDHIITCVDKGDEMYFYDGKYDLNDVESANSYILAKKDKVDHAIEGYIYFGLNKKVEIYPIFGDFQQKGKSKNLIVLSRFVIDTTYEVPPEIAKLYGKHYKYTWADSIIRNNHILDNVIYFSDKNNTIETTNYKEINSNTKVKSYSKTY